MGSFFLSPCGCAALQSRRASGSHANAARPDRARLSHDSAQLAAVVVLVAESKQCFGWRPLVGLARQPQETFRDELVSQSAGRPATFRKNLAALAGETNQARLGRRRRRATSQQKSISGRLDSTRLDGTVAKALIVRLHSARRPVRRPAGRGGYCTRTIAATCLLLLPWPLSASPTVCRL